jgi:signal peptidase II
MLDLVVVEPTPAAHVASQRAPSFGDRIRRRWKNDLVFFGIALVILFFDQLTKALVRQNLELYEVWPEGSDSFIRIIHVVNSGAAFGILQGQTSFLIMTSLLGLAAIVLYYVYPPMDHGLIEVTDFIDVGEFPTFNIADASISISIVAVLLFFLQQETSGAGDKPGDAPGQQQQDAGTGANED